MFKNYRYLSYTNIVLYVLIDTVPTIFNKSWKTLPNSFSYRFILFYPSSKRGRDVVEGIYHFHFYILYKVG